MLGSMEYMYGNAKNAHSHPSWILQISICNTFVQEQERVEDERGGREGVELVSDPINAAITFIHSLLKLFYIVGGSCHRTTTGTSFYRFIQSRC